MIMFPLFVSCLACMIGPSNDRLLELEHGVFHLDKHKYAGLSIKIAPVTYTLCSLLHLYTDSLPQPIKTILTPWSVTLIMKKK